MVVVRGGSLVPSVWPLFSVSPGLVVVCSVGALLLVFGVISAYRLTHLIRSSIKKPSSNNLKGRDAELTCSRAYFEWPISGTGACDDGLANCRASVDCRLRSTFLFLALGGDLGSGEGDGWYDTFGSSGICSNTGDRDDSARGVFVVKKEGVRSRPAILIQAVRRFNCSTVSVTRQSRQW